MSLVSVRHWSRQWCRIRSRGYSATSSAPTSRKEKNEGPVFQYVGKHRKTNHKVYVWGFSYTGALGIPSFVVPDTGRKKPRKYQLTPYRLETEHQVSLNIHKTTCCLEILRQHRVLLRSDFVLGVKYIYLDLGRGEARLSNFQTAKLHLMMV